MPAAGAMSAHRAVMVAVAGAVLVLVAFIFDAAPLLVPAVALTGLGVLAPGGVWLAARGARAGRELQADRVVEGEQFEAVLEVTRRWGWGGVTRIHVLDPFTGADFDAWASPDAVRERRRAAVHMVATLPHRGLHRLPAPSLVVTDPLQLATVHAAGGSGGQEILVLPATEPVRWLQRGLARRLLQPEGFDASDALAAADLDGLRPYRVGTPASRIHWPAVARGAGLMERRLRPEGDARPLVVLDTRAGADAQRLVDAAVRAAASLVLELARARGCGLLLPGDRRPTTIEPDLLSWPAVYARLALVQGGPAVRAPMLGGGAGGARLGATIYVAAAPAERALAALPTGRPAILVAPADALAAGRPGEARGLQAALSVSGCQGFLIGAARRQPAHRQRERVR